MNALFLSDYKGLKSIPDGNYLTSNELKKLFLRRDRLIKHIRKQIKKYGENKVLYDYK